MIVILTDEDLEAIKNGEMIKVKSVMDIPAGGTFGIATQKWVDDTDNDVCPGPGYVNVYGQWVPKEDHSNYENAIFNGECD